MKIKYILATMCFLNYVAVIPQELEDKYKKTKDEAFAMSKRIDAKEFSDVDKQLKDSDEKLKAITDKIDQKRRLEKEVKQKHLDEKERLETEHKKLQTKKEKKYKEYNTLCQTMLEIAEQLIKIAIQQEVFDLNNHNPADFSWKAGKGIPTVRKTRSMQLSHNNMTQRKKFFFWAYRMNYENIFFQLQDAIDKNENIDRLKKLGWKNPEKEDTPIKAELEEENTKLKAELQKTNARIEELETKARTQELESKLKEANARIEELEANAKIKKLKSELEEANAKIQELESKPAIPTMEQEI